MRLASFAQRSCGAAANSMRMAALSTTFEQALLKRVKNYSFASASVGPWEILLGRRYRRTRRAAASRGGCPSTADDEEKGLTAPLHLQFMPKGRLAPSPGSCRIIAV